ncbi:MAG TPA: hypothetical protein DCM87_13795 [Planctomycetes bacterium]|nr:hypothetical protein [Planctomycetota bacterium]
MGDFWAWSTSDLLDNTARGVLAEFLVGLAVGAPLDGVREEWAPFDLEADGIKIEVKSAAYVQRWTQRKLSSIVFRVPKTLPWDADAGTSGTEPGRQADVYVFALLGHRDKSTIDPLNVAQWEFYALSRKTLDERRRSQHSITLRSLRSLAGPAVPFEGLGAKVKQVYGAGDGRAPD